MIYIAKHKEVETLVQDGYVPLNMWEIREKDNVCEYNRYINELVAHYHIWKHTDDDVKGIVQYRKYLIDDLTNKPIIPSIDGLATKIYVNEEIKKIDVTSQLGDYAKKSDIYVC